MSIKRSVITLAVFSSFLYFCGCGSKQDKETNENKQLPGTVNFGRLSDYSPGMLEITDSLRLEESENVMLGAITQCQIVENSVYLLDYQKSRVLASYSLEDGSLQNYKVAGGDGPGELLWSYSFDVDNQNGFFYILDKMQGKMLRYSLSDWSFVEDIALPVGDVRSFTALDDERFLYYVHGQADDVEVGKNQIVTADTKGHLLSAMFPDPGSGKISMGAKGVFSKTAEGMLFVPYFSNQEYLVSPDTITLAHTYEWGNAPIVPLDFFPEEIPETLPFVEHLMNENYVRTVQVFHAGNTVAACYWIKKQQYVSFFNSQTGRALNCKVTDEFPVPVAVYEDKIVGAVMDDEGGITLYFYRYK